MKTKRIFYITLTLFIIFGTSFSILSTLTENPSIEQKINDKILNEIEKIYEEDLKLASNGKDLNYTSIYRNTTQPIHKVFDSIKITVNTYGFADIKNTTMIIWFSQDFPVKYNMTKVGSTTNYTKIYTPLYSDPIGFMRVTFEIYNTTADDPINSGNTATNFTIQANCLASMEVIEFYVLPSPDEQILKADLVLDNSSNFDWIIFVVDNNSASFENVLFVYGNNKVTISFYINNSFAPENKQYYIKVNLTEKTGSHRWDVQYFGFIVKVPLKILDEPTIEFNPTSVYRTKLCTITLNVTATLFYLNPSYVNVTLTLKDTNSYTIISNQNFTNNNDESFIITFSVSSNRPAGLYSYTIKTIYKKNLIEEYNNTVLIKNNPPEIDGYEINDYGTKEHISVRYGETLKFQFDVSDIEDRISYITVLLINEEGDEYEISREYEADLIIEVRTEDLITGTWIVYVSVTDLDGDTTELDDDFNDAPKEIEIIPDTFGTILPWISLVIGIIVGIVSGIGMSYYLVKKQKLKFEPEEVKEVPKEKSLKTKKEKIVKSETEKELEKEEIKKAEPKKEEPRKIRPPRKIKRKLR